MALSSIEALIVDDDPLACERLETLLSTHGMRGISVDSLESACDAMRTIYFPLVIVDRHLADGDGIDLCREVRARQFGRRVHILMLSTSDSPEELQRAIAAGADDCLSKSCPGPELITRVQRLYALALRRRLNGYDTDHERARLRVLEQYGVLDTPPEQAYDDITRLTSIVCKKPFALISFIDERRQWFKSKLGLDATEIPREHTLCAHALGTPNEVFVVGDARADARFAHDPLVVHEPRIRFYAGVALMSQEGCALGTLSVMDARPGTLDEVGAAGLRALSRQVMRLLDHRKSRRELELASIAQRVVDADLRRSEAIFREAYENAPIGIALVSVKGGWLRVNRSLCEILGYSPAELLRTTFQAVTHPDDLDADLNHVREMLEGSIRTYQMEKRYVHKAGHIVWAQLNVSLVRDEHDEPLFFVSHVQDISRAYGRGSASSCSRE